MRKIIAFVLIFNMWVLTVFSQTCICPGDVSVQGPAGIVSVGENAVFTVNIKGDKDNQSTLNWSVSNGMIISGQGTKSITVQTNAEMAGQTITATVQIGGNIWCSECGNMTASETAVIEELPKPVLVDKFTRGNCEEVLARMDYFFTELQNNPDAAGYFIAYGKPRVVNTAIREANNWIKIRRFDVNRITIVKGGGNSDSAEIEMWRVPAGADAPEIKSSPDTVETEPKKAVTNPKEPYIFSSEYYDGIAGCGNDDGSGLDLEGYAEMLKENPKSRGNIVIMNLSKTEFRQKEREILQFLTKQGINRTRLKTFHQKVFGGVELWFLP